MIVFTVYIYGFNHIFWQIYCNNQRYSSPRYAVSLSVSSPLWSCPTNVSSDTRTTSIGSCGLFSGSCTFLQSVATKWCRYRVEYPQSQLEPVCTNVPLYPVSSNSSRSIACKGLLSWSLLPPPGSSNNTFPGPGRNCLARITFLSVVSAKTHTLFPSFLPQNRMWYFQNWIYA